MENEKQTIEITIKEIYEFINEGAKNPFEKVVTDAWPNVRDEDGNFAYSPGHVYFMNHTLQGWDLEGKNQFNFGIGNIIGFIQKRQDTGEVTPGITNEQLLTVLLARYNHLNGKFPCQENLECIYHLMEALRWACKRYADRYEREVLGMHQL